MAAFKGAVGVGAHALETDLHLSADGVVVLSHVSRSVPMTRRRRFTEVEHASPDMIVGTQLTCETTSGPDSETMLRCGCQYRGLSMGVSQYPADA